MSEKLDLIRKYSQDIPDRTSPRKAKPVSLPSGPAKTSDVPAKNVPSVDPGKNIGPVSSTILSMQKAIQDFASNTVSYKADAKNPNAVSQNDKRKDFNDFLAEQYSAGASLHGKEWDPSEKATKIENKRPTEIIELDNVINNLRRIGPGSRENIADGSWGPRTNEALKNIYAFAESLVKSAQDFGSNIQGFNKNDLLKLQKYIPQSDPKKYKDLPKRAELITPLIVKLTDYYNKYSKNIFNHPEYTQYISKETPLFKVSPSQADSTNIPDDLKQANLSTLKLYDISLPNKHNELVNFPELSLSCLQDMNSFKKLMSTQLGYAPNDIINPDVVNKVLDSIIEFTTRKPNSKPLQMAI